MPREAKIGATKDTYVYRLRLPHDLKTQWDAHCEKKNKEPATLLRALMRYVIQDDMPPEVQRFVKAQTRPAADHEPKMRFEILLTQSERAAIQERAELERCSQRRWIIDAIRAGLTKEPQFGMKEIEALGESNYQLLAIGRNLNQVAKVMNEGKRHSVTVDSIERLRQIIDGHVKKVGGAIRASIDRWNIE